MRARIKYKQQYLDTKAELSEARRLLGQVKADLKRCVSSLSVYGESVVSDLRPFYDKTELSKHEWDAAICHMKGYMRYASSNAWDSWESVFPTHFQYDGRDIRRSK